jgi:hypothetical protein
VQKDQRCCGGDTIKAHAQFYRETKYDFVASENYMYATMDTDRYTYITVLRNSLSRYYSHYNYIDGNNITKTNFSQWMDGQPDNWNVRHICGTKCMHIAKYGLGVHEFKFTVDRLRKFAHISLVEHYNSSITELSRILKWEHNISVKINSLKYRIHATSSEYANMTYLDDLLYSYVLAMQRGHTDRIKEEIISNASIYVQLNYNDRSRYSLPCGAACTLYR